MTSDTHVPCPACDGSEVANVVTCSTCGGLGAVAPETRAAFLAFKSAGDTAAKRRTSSGALKIDLTSDPDSERST